MRTVALEENLLPESFLRATGADSRALPPARANLQPKLLDIGAMASPPWTRLVDFQGSRSPPCLGV